MTNEDKYRQAAIARQKDGELEVDFDAVVFMRDDPGAYVQAWLWIPASEAGVAEPDKED